LFQFSDAKYSEDCPLKKPNLLLQADRQTRVVAARSKNKMSPGGENSHYFVSFFSSRTETLAENGRQRESGGVQSKFCKTMFSVAQTYLKGTVLRDFVDLPKSGFIG